MNVATCTLIAQIIPLLLIVTTWFNARIAKLKGQGRQGFAYWNDLLGLIFPLLSLVLCVFGVNQGGLTEGWQVALALVGFIYLLSHVLLNALYTHGVELPD